MRSADCWRWEPCAPSTLSALRIIYIMSNAVFSRMSVATLPAGRQSERCRRTAGKPGTLDCKAARIRRRCQSQRAQAARPSMLSSPVPATAALPRSAAPSTFVCECRARCARAPACCLLQAGHAAPLPAFETVAGSRRALHRHGETQVSAAARDGGGSRERRDAEPVTGQPSEAPAARASTSQEWTKAGRRVAQAPA